MKQLLFIKDIQLLVKGLKFQVIFVLMMILFILSSISSAVAYKEMSNSYIREINEHSDRLNDENSVRLNNLVGNMQLLKVISKPTPAVLFSDYNAFPDIISSGVVFHTPNFQKLSNENTNLFSLNWNFILGVLSSLFILILSFDTISQEKRGGTLRLLSIYGFKRQTIIWSKFLSIFVLYLVITIPAALISMIIFFSITGAWSVIYMLKFILMLLISIPFVSFFIFIGIFISLLKNHRIAILQAVLVWLFFLIIIPQSSILLGERISPVKTNMEYSKMREKAWNDEFNIWENDYGRSVSGNEMLDDGLRAKAVYASDEKRNLITQLENNDSRKQTLVIRNILNISPFSQLENISEIVFDKGFYLFNHQLNESKQTIILIRNLMIEQDSRDENSLHLFYSWARTDGRFRGKTPFSTQIFNNKELLLITEFQTDDTLTKIIKIIFNLIPIIMLNLLLIICSVLKIERLDIR